MKHIFIIFVLFLSACSMDGEVSEESQNKHMKCTDFRDGETFTYNTNNITNVRIGIGAPSSFDFIDDNGKSRTLSQEMEAYMKCEEIK